MKKLALRKKTPPPLKKKKEISKIDSNSSATAQQPSFVGNLNNPWN